jgi:hypothetical protein
MNALIKDKAILSFILFVMSYLEFSIIIPPTTINPLVNDPYFYLFAMVVIATIGVIVLIWYDETGGNEGNEGNKGNEVDVQEVIKEA